MSEMKKAMIGTLAKGGRLLALSLVAGAMLTACASERRSEPLVGRFAPKTTAEVHGERVFFQFCHQCHPGGEAGLGPALNDKPVPDVAIRTQVREGLGAMPAFEATEIPDRDLDQLLAYLSALRAHGS